MLGAVGRACGVWWDRVKLMSPLWASPAGRFLAHDLRYPELQEVMRADGPELEPYQGLCPFWDHYGSAQLPGYISFLPALARRRGVALRSVLDLACGTGLLTTQFNAVVGEVVGLDASEHMLARARKRHGDQPGIGFACGDFRDFDIGRQFDAAVCASNSLNYVADRGELSRVFAAVGRHLRPGGLFVFDTQTERWMRALSGHFLHVEAGRRRFAIGFSYDASRRKEASRVYLPAGVETHWRIPLDPIDVWTAAEGTGLEIEDYFSSALWPRDWGQGYCCFFVLVKPA